MLQDMDHIEATCALDVEVVTFVQSEQSTI